MLRLKPMYSYSPDTQLHSKRVSTKTNVLRSTEINVVFARPFFGISSSDLY